MVSNPLDPDLMTASERLAEAAYLLARGILRRRLRAADGRQKRLDVSADSSHSCLEPRSDGRDT